MISDLPHAKEHSLWVLGLRTKNTFKVRPNTRGKLKTLKFVYSRSVLTLELRLGLGLESLLLYSEQDINEPRPNFGTVFFGPTCHMSYANVSPIDAGF